MTPGTYKVHTSKRNSSERKNTYYVDSGETVCKIDEQLPCLGPIIWAYFDLFGLFGGVESIKNMTLHGPYSTHF